jgi:C1A family cysteine protease
MSNLLIKLTIALIAIYFAQSVIVTHVNNDIRTKIMQAMKEKPLKEQFKVFHLIYNKDYNLNSEMGIKKYRVFKENVKFINAHNAKNLSYKLGINSMADLTSEEFKKSKLSKINPQNLGYFLGDDLAVEPNSEETVTQTTKIDWTPNMATAKNQGSCGSCWAFASIGAIEGNYNIKYKQSLEFSEQQLVDCDSSNGGCEGGWPTYAYNYIINNKGISYYNDYPYTSGDLSDNEGCKTNVAKNNVVAGYESCNYRSCEITKWKSMLAKGPMVVIMDADGDSVENKIFRFYSEGIIESDMTCDGVNHAVIAVGVDSDAKGEYLIARNSWGSGWGEAGNFRIRVRSSDNTCFMQDYALLPIVQRVNPVPPAPQSNCLMLFSQCFNKGDVREFCQNTPTIANFPSISGVNLGKYKSARLYLQSSYCKGSYYTINESFPCFPETIPALTNNVKSIVVDEEVPPTGCVWFYSDYCLTGERIQICANVPDLAATQFNFSNKISSFKIGPGVTSLTYYLDINYMGNHATTSRDNYGMYGTWMNKQIVSVKINK